MFIITDNAGKELDREPRGLKVRLGQVFRTPGQTMTEFMGELRLLTKQDEDDLRGAFNASGYATT